MDLEKINVEKELKIIFMGTPDFSVPILKGLIENYKVRAIVTQPDKLVGRQQKLVCPPIKQVGIDNTILVLQPNKIKDYIITIKEMDPDLIVTCAYGKILPKELLDIPRLGCINVHASLLPKLRGGAPIHRSIINGYKKTGITIMYMNEKMDEGDIISQKEIEITETETAETLHDKLSILGRNLLLETLPSIINKTNKRTKQNNEEATYGFVITREDEKIDFNKTKREIYNQIRGLNSWPGAYCLIDNKILKVWESIKTNNTYPDKINGEITNIYEEGFGIKVSDGEIVFTKVQPEGKTKMNASDYARGMINKGNFIGKILG
ncbi:MAG: methionyl-tRNA formyltransferase [Bacilli bacterium]|nr:methionyl-tRNA formyltransferase [Bacilli bacterium]